MEKRMEPDTSKGQVEAASGDGQAAETSKTSEGQSVTSNQTTGNGSEGEAIESFFDPKTIEGKPELQAAYRQMQGEFTKRLQGVQSHQSKIDAYDAFERDPQGTIERLSKQYGYDFVQSDPNQDGDSKPPKTWDDVYAIAEERALIKLRKEFAPLTNEVQDLKRKGVESQLDATHPDWRTYEGRMVDTLKAHPSMANDPDALYRMSLPPELLEQRATKAALAKLKGEGASSEVSGNQTTSITTTTEPTGRLTIDQAVKFAREKLAAQGIKRPVGD
jgi:hypothetical protein